MTPTPTGLFYASKDWWHEAKNEVRIREGMGTYSNEKTLIAGGHIQGIVAERAFCMLADLDWREEMKRTPAQDGRQFTVNNTTIKVAGVSRIAEGLSVKCHEKARPRCRKSYSDIYVVFRIGVTRAAFVGWCAGGLVKEQRIIQGRPIKGASYTNDYQFVHEDLLNPDPDELRLALRLTPLLMQGALL